LQETFPASPIVLKLVRYVLASAADGELWGLASMVQRETAEVTEATLGWSQQQQQQQQQVEAAAVDEAAGAAAAAAQQLLRRLSSGRRRRRSSLPTSGSPVTEDMVLSSLNLLSLGLHALKRRLDHGLGLASDTAADVQSDTRGEAAVKFSKHECEVVEEVLSASGVRSWEYQGPGLAVSLVTPVTPGGTMGDIGAAAAAGFTSSSSSSSIQGQLPGIVPSLLLLSLGRTAATKPDCDSAAVGRRGAAEVQQPAAAGAAAAPAAVLSADVQQCARALLPLAQEVLGRVQGLLRPEQAAAAGQGSAVEVQDDRKEQAKARQVCVKTQLACHQSAGLYLYGVS
jgi:hypothetical protein